MQKLESNLWFDNQAEEAVNFYISVFKNASVLRKTRYGKEGYEIHKMPEGTIMTIEFELEGQKFIALNGGPQFKFTEAISFFVSCDTQKEIDYYWEKLSAGGSPGKCGWLKDKFGVSWQIIPPILGELLNDHDEAKSQRAMQAMLKMSKIDIKQLNAAAKGK